MKQLYFRSCVSNNATDFSQGRFLRYDDVSSQLEDAMHIHPADCIEPIEKDDLGTVDGRQQDFLYQQQQSGYMSKNFIHFLLDSLSL